MAKKKISDELADKLKSIAKTENIIIGTERVIKEMKKNRIKHVFLSSNCPENVKAEIEHYARLINAEVTATPYPNDELGIMFKKQFSISVFGY